MRKLPEEQDIVKLYIDDNWTMQQIADLHKVDRSTIGNRLKKLHVQSNRHPNILSTHPLL
jgi:predicted DNA-binding protein YlxM (UPF0122 family)